MPDFVNADDVRVIQLGDDFGFVQKSTGHFRVIGDVFFQHLDGHFPLERFLLGQVNNGHAALADFAQNGVASDSHPVDGHGFWPRATLGLGFLLVLVGVALAHAFRAEGSVKGHC